MSVSRIDKLIFEVSGGETIAEAAARRNKPLQIITRSLDNEKSALMVRMAIDLGLRVFNGEIYVFVESGTTEAADKLMMLSVEYDGRERLLIKNSIPDPNLPSIRIGEVCGHGHIADAKGWNSFIDMTAPDDGWASVPACAFAVSCAFSRLVKSGLLASSASPKPWLFNLLTLKSEYQSDFLQLASEEFDLGHLALLGAGAIGSSFAYLVTLSRWKGRIDVIDSQRYEEPNHETSLMISHADAIASPKKAEHLAALLAMDGRIAAKGFTARVDDTSDLLRVKRDVFICGVDNTETRQRLDAVNATLLLNAGLGGTKFDAGHVLYTEHTFRDPKLSSCYQSKVLNTPPALDARVPAEFKDQCSRLNYESASLAAPFLALASAALVLSGVVRRAVFPIGAVNYLKLDLLGQQSSFYAKERPSEVSALTLEPLIHP